MKTNVNPEMYRAYVNNYKHMIGGNRPFSYISYMFNIDIKAQKHLNARKFNCATLRKAMYDAFAEFGIKIKIYGGNIYQV